MARFATSSVTACIRVGFLVLTCGWASPGAGQPVEPGLGEAGLAGAGTALIPALWLAPNPARVAALPGWRIETFASEGFGLEELRLLAAAAGGPIGRSALGAEIRQFGFTHYRELDGRLGFARRVDLGVPAGLGGAVHGGLTRITGLPADRALGGSVGAWIRPHPLIYVGGQLARPADRYGTANRPTGAIGLGIRLSAESRLLLGADPLGSVSSRMAAGLRWRPLPPLAVSAGWRADPSTLAFGATVYLDAGADGRRGTVFGGATGQTHPVLGWTPAVGLGWSEEPVERALVERRPVEGRPIEGTPVERAPVERAPIERGATVGSVAGSAESRTSPRTPETQASLGPTEPRTSSRPTGPPSSISTAPPDSLTEELIEAIRADPDAYTGAALEAALAHLRRLRDHPVDVNASGVPVLSQIPGLDPVLAGRIVRFRRAYGPFDTLEELLAVRGMSSTRYRSARPYLRLEVPADRAGRSSSPSGAAGPRPGTGETASGTDRAAAEQRRPVRTSLMHRTDRRLDLGRGYRTDPREGGYLGSPYRYVTRLRVEIPDDRGGPGSSYHPLLPRLARIGVTAEKDPGEPMRWHAPDRQFGFDHTSGYLTLTGSRPRGGRVERDAVSAPSAGSHARSARPFYTAILGDYRLKAGHGLLFGGGYSPGKSGQIGGSPFGTRSGPSGYGSTGEDGYYRGAALRLFPAPSLRGWTFVSRRNRDGILDRGSGEPDSVRTLRGSGLHRTVSETAPRSALRETVLGGGLSWSRGTGGLEVTGYRSQFEPPLAQPPRRDRPDPFRGESWRAGSLAGHLSLGPTYLFGEIARGGRGRHAGLMGLQAAVTEYGDLALHYRRFPTSFWSPYGGAFGEQSGAPENENGLFAGLQLRPTDRWRLRLYTDQFRFPGPRYGVPRPTAGHEEFLRADYEWGRDRALHIQIRTKTRESGRSVTTDLGPVRTVGPEQRVTGRVQVSVPLHPRIRLRVRGSGVRTREPVDHLQAAITPERGSVRSRENDGRLRQSWGVGAFTDLRYRPIRSLRIDARATRFRTDDYASRIYQLENDLYYAFSVPALFGNGYRAYLLSAWSPFRRLTLEAKYALTVVHDRSRLGSGWEELQGNRRREVRVQVRWTGRW